MGVSPCSPATREEKSERRTPVRESMSSAREVERLLRQAEAAEAAARATLMSPEQERVVIDAAEALAGSDAGVPAKSRCS